MTRSIGKLDQQNIRLAVGCALLSGLQAEILVFPLAAAILQFRLPVMSGRLGTSPIELLDIDNVGVAVGIASLSSLLAEILVFPV